ncbi:AGAP005834-PA-like protein [Anopheles sinensis]|uniref:Carboxylic ester hydrolase n=1 Tax=Anopheles sinensis TaxID=74873 RepID=A0A084WE78_ANOSI|nr:AGAP005834-PA-like protein [Anopheles sinensis]
MARVVVLFLFLVVHCVVSCTSSGSKEGSPLIAASRKSNASSCHSKEQLRPPRVCIGDGCLQGTFMDGLKAGPFEAFFGIPFARPPVGELRFANPVPNDPWTEETYNATSEKSMCLQRNDLLVDPTVQGSEDCLYLNVYRPKGCDNSTRKLPVMVYIHGGGFFAGTASPWVVGPEYIMDTGRVILVTIQYRLGVLGFLSTGDAAAPGNFGLKDQTLALQWVQRNIRHFGGDPRLVTIFGQSAGAASVHMHMISPLSRGLFQRAIMMSGNALVPWNIPTENPLTLARATARVVGVEGSEKLSTRKLIEALQTVPGEKLVATTKQLKAWSIDPLTLFRPVVESRNSPVSFLVDKPTVSWQNGEYQQVPWLAGFVPNEGAVRALAIFKNEKLLSELKSNFTTILPILLERPPSTTLFDRVRSRFFKDSTSAEPIRSEDLQSFVDLYSEAAFTYPIQLGVKQYAAFADTVQAPVGVYKFSFKGRFSYSAIYAAGDTGDYGVVHCDDLNFLFRSPAIFPDYPAGSPELRMVDTFVNFFIDFAINGRTTPLAPYRECKNENQIYQSMDCDVQEFTRDGDNVKVKVFNGRNEDMFAFWKDFY